MADHPSTLGDILRDIDSQVREAHARAHSALIRQLARTEAHTIAHTEIPKEAMIPRDVLEGASVSMKFDVFLYDGGASLSQGFRLTRGGSRAKVRMEWRAVAAPEATALIRTKAETVLAKDIKHG